MTSQFDAWVAATATRNWCLQDPILDWLDLYGADRGFLRDNLLEGYNPETDMGLFMREKGRAFEAAVMRCLAEKFQIVRIAESGRDAQDPALYKRTLRAMEEGVEIIAQAVVQDSARQTYGIPDLLVRSDVLNRLVEEAAISDEEAQIPSPALRGRAGEGVNSELPIPNSKFQTPFHYRVLDIKFTTLDLNAGGQLSNGESERAKKAQLLVYNRALGEMQGYEPPTAYLLGRGWKRQKNRGDSCFDLLAPADMADPELAELVDNAVDWVRRVREDGAGWQVAPKPSVKELYPNMSNTRDSPWHNAKRQIAEDIGELTLLWQVSPKRRPIAHQAGVVTFSDPRCDSTVFGLADSYAAKLQKVIEINREACPDKVRPAAVLSGQEVWREPNPLEFYVDFETVTDLDDDFGAIPKKGGQSMIYMIGCGHVEDGEWRFRVFTCNLLKPDCEREIIDAWHAHMAEVQARLWPDGTPLVFHWSHAEQSFLNSAYNSARNRHQADWPELNWYDFLVQVMREEPVTVKGALAFGLKAVAKAMHRNGLIEKEWTNGPGSGLDAMIGAWRCDAQARFANGSMRDTDLMKSIEDYNEVDCKVMWEIVSYLRAHH